MVVKLMLGYVQCYNRRVVIQACQEKTSVQNKFRRHRGTKHRVWINLLCDVKLTYIIVVILKM